MYVVDLWQQGESKPRRLYLRAAGISIAGAPEQPPATGVEFKPSRAELQGATRGVVAHTTGAELGQRPDVSPSDQSQAPSRQRSIVDEDIEFYDRLILRPGETASKP
jgi:hypothetical protein